MPPAGFTRKINDTHCGEKRMRMMKLALITGIAVLIGSGSA
jgi:hypothetical protein